MATLLLTNAYVVTVDPDRSVIPRGWVAVEDDRIAAIGSMDELGDRSADELIDLGGKLLMPGLVNGHNHHWGSLFKNTGENMFLEDWIEEITLPLGAQLTNADLRAAAYLGAIEQIRTGTTCSLNHVFNINDPDSMQAMIEPVIEVGVRQLVTKELRETPDPPFSSRYPSRPHIRGRDEEIALAEEVVDRWDGAGGVIHMGLAIEANENWLLHNSTSEEIVFAGLDLARRRDLKITNHCSSGTPWRSHREFVEETGGGDVDYLSRIGALDDHWILAHALHMTDREIDHLARAGASVITCPVSTAYTCGGVAPVKGMLEAGVTVGLGTDGTYVNCSPDMVEQMKFAALIQNVTHMDATLMTSERAIEMATIGSAKAMGLDHLIGSLEVGKKADMVAFDLGRAHTTVGNRPVGALVFSAHGTDADTVVVDGRVVLRGGDLVGFSGEQEVLAEATRRAGEVIERAGLADRVYVHWRRDVHGD
jgi:5-methylthioadenosine/S-adenosylhomocysteine deaminase